MKWIKGMWDETEDIIFVNPDYVTAVDTGRGLLWAQDCDVAVKYDKEDFPLVLKLIGRTEEEALDNGPNTNISPSKKENGTRSK